MTKYKKIFFSVFFGFIILFVGLLLYASKTSDDSNIIRERLHTVIPDSLIQITITPMNPEWKVNLTLDTIRIRDKKTMTEITENLNKMNKDYPGRGTPQTWDAYLILDYKNNKNIMLEVVNANKGICVFFTNTMGNPHYICNGLKSVLENVANYKENLGK